MDPSIQGAEDAVRYILRYIGEDVGREGLRETPSRVRRSWDELFSGYSADVEGLFKTFKEGACDEMIVVRDIDFHSMCEHHMLPFVGVAHVAYIPKGRIVGLSKIARLVEVFARRLQVQERMTIQITEAIQHHLNPQGCACVIEAKHLCMACRGVRKSGSSMVTSSLKGTFSEEPDCRNEFLQLIHMRR